MNPVMPGMNAKQILEKKIADGRAAAVDVFERINRDAPKDMIAKGKALEFSIVNPGGDSGALEVGFPGDAGFSVHPHALQQFASRAGVPSAYLSESLASKDAWRHNLVASILGEHYGKGLPNTRYLVRAVRGQIRGFLSNKYRRLDSRPLIDAFAQECQKIGAVPVDGTCSDTRVAMKALIPTVYEPVAGEALAFGIEWSNSDFGNGIHAIRAFLLRLWCLNGATMENALAQVHLGRQLGDDIDLSQRTYELDTRTSISALRDVVAGTLAPKKIEALCAGIQEANAKQIDWKAASGKLAKKLLKGEMEEAKRAFESPDVVNLPAGQSVWRASNALSWLAGQAEDPDRKLELQRLAGEMIHGRSEVAAAA